MECKRCGSCCHFERKIVDGKIIDSDPCPFLSFDDKGLASCDIYENRPFVCKNYSCKKRPLIEGKKWSAKGVKIELNLI